MSSSIAAIHINPIASVISGVPFTITGILTGFPAVPALSYINDPHPPHPASIKGVAEGTEIDATWPAPPPLIFTRVNNATVTAQQFSFIHGALLSPGPHTIFITDGTISGSVQIQVTAPVDIFQQVNTDVAAANAAMAVAEQTMTTLKVRIARLANTNQANNVRMSFNTLLAEMATLQTALAALTTDAGKLPA